MNKLVYGKDSTERIVSVEVGDDTSELFILNDDGTIRSEFRPHKHWILYADQYSKKMKRLEGDLYYKYRITYDSLAKYQEVIGMSYKKKYQFYTARDPKQNFMLDSGVTYYKGLKVEDVSVLSFDLEHTYGLNLDPNGKILLISNAFQKNGKVTKKLFAYDDYPTQADMLTAWIEWVQIIDPSIINGHNIIGHDFPVLKLACEKASVPLELGRDKSSVKFDERTRQFRKDGSQAYDFNDVHIYGREIVDGFFLSIKHDIQRKYPSYGLKEIIRYECLEKKNRQHYDASKIKSNHMIPEEWKKIKEYAKDDADDSLSLYNLMIPSFFYYCSHLPRSLQETVNSATGSQVNGIMVRSYLQEGHSIPKADKKTEDFEGAISFGVPGIHKNVFKIDVASLYPSIMLQYQIGPGKKDPKNYFLSMLEYFTSERLENKKQGQETGNRYFQDLEQAQKIVINSCYGFMGAPGVNFNNLGGAAEVTRRGREILLAAIYYATGKEFRNHDFIGGNQTESYFAA